MQVPRLWPALVRIAAPAALACAGCEAGGNMVRAAAHPFAPEPAPPRPPVRVLHRIVAKHSGLFLGIREARTDEGADAIQWTDTGGREEMFEIVPASGGRVRFRAAHSGLWLGVSGDPSVRGARVVQLADDRSPATAWRLVPDGGEWFRVVSDASEQHLAIALANRGPGEIAIQWTDSGGDEQRWRFSLAPDGRTADGSSPDSR